MTTAYLATPIDFAPYGPVKTVEFVSRIHGNSIFRWKEGKAYYREYELAKHANTCGIAVDKIGARMDRGERIPQFRIREGPGYVDGSPIVIKGGSKEMNDELINLRIQNASLKSEVQKVRFEATTEKSKRQTAEELWGEQQNETQTLWKTRLNINDSGFLRVMGYIKDYGTLEECAKILSQGKSNKYIKWLVPGAIAALIIVGIYTQPQLFDKLLAWLSIDMNRYTVIALGIMTVIGLYIFYRRRRSGV